MGKHETNIYLQIFTKFCKLGMKVQLSNLKEVSTYRLWLLVMVYGVILISVKERKKIKKRRRKTLVKQFLLLKTNNHIMHNFEFL